MSKINMLQGIKMQALKMHLKLRDQHLVIIMYIFKFL